MDDNSNLPLNYLDRHRRSLSDASFQEEYLNARPPMDLIHLDDCIVQPKAILAISKETVFDPDFYKTQYPKDDESKEGWGWVPIIQVMLFHQEKRVVKFGTKEYRDYRYAEIVAQMSKAK